jgi:3-oxoacyl-[acyl-carrier-protein] synthase-3
VTAPPTSPAPAPLQQPGASTGVARRSAIAGLGYFLPASAITNLDLAAIVETSDEWITSRTGIRSRRRADECDATSDLAARAAGRAIADAGLSVDDIDFVLLATATPDAPVPAASCHVLELLGAHRAAAMDINAGCSGFLYGLHTADAMVRSGAHRNVLVIGAEILTRITDYTDRRTCVLFGDGAGACVMSARGGLELLYSGVWADSEQRDLIRVPGGGSRRPPSSETIAGREHYLRLDGQRVFRQAVRRMVEAAAAALETTGLSAEDVSWVIPHQANERIITAVAEQLNIPAPQVVLDVAETGNTSAASVPIALTRARDAGSFRPGQNILLLAFGAGLTWACQLLRVGE